MCFRKSVLHPLKTPRPKKKTPKLCGFFVDHPCRFHSFSNSFQEISHAITSTHSQFHVFKPIIWSLNPYTYDTGFIGGFVDDVVNNQTNYQFTWVIVISLLHIKFTVSVKKNLASNVRPVFFTLAHLRFSFNNLPCLIVGDCNSGGGLVKFVKIHKKGEGLFKSNLYKKQTW